MTTLFRDSQHEESVTASAPARHHFDMFIFIVVVVLCDYLSECHVEVERQRACSWLLSHCHLGVAALEVARVDDKQVCHRCSYRQALQMQVTLHPFVGRVVGQPEVVAGERCGGRYSVGAIVVHLVNGGILSVGQLDGCHVDVGQTGERGLSVLRCPSVHKLVGEVLKFRRQVSALVSRLQDGLATDAQV